jgi:K+-sensing histidine kinase KdpD
VIFMPERGGVRAVANSGGGAITRAEEEAATGVVETRLPARADTYPYDKSAFDLWPVQTPDTLACVIGVSFLRAHRARPAEPERFIEIVAAYLAIALASRPL